MKRNSILLFFALNLMVACSGIDKMPPTALVSEPTNTMTATVTLPQVLFIGNSYTYTNSLPDEFEKLMRSGGHEILVEQAAMGGWSLSNHVMSSATLGKIAERDWDYVILQEQNVVNYPETGMYPAMRTLDQLVRDAGAKTILFLNWGRKDGLPASGFPDYESVQAQIYANSVEIANELDAIVAPVGVAWQTALARDAGIELWGEDGSHPSRSGTYLAACVFYAVMTLESPEGLEHPADISGEMALFLQKIAAETVLDQMDMWGLERP
ncbi:hypothetical protein EG832_16670 [bacterium]|nr:hypothetical protein [bacterium]